MKWTQPLSVLSSPCALPFGIFRIVPRCVISNGKVESEYNSRSYRAFVCLGVRPCVRAFVCSPVYVPLCAALCTSFTATNRARRQVETKLASLVLITIQVSHYFVCDPEMSCIDFFSASSYDANERTCNVVNYTCEKLTFMESPSV